MRLLRALIAIARPVLVAGFALAIAGVGAAQQSTQPTYRLFVDGLACPYCAYGIEKKLGAIEGVGDIAVDIETGTVTVAMADGASLDETTARAAVEAAGFTLRGFEEVQASERTDLLGR